MIISPIRTSVYPVRLISVSKTKAATKLKPNNITTRRGHVHVSEPKLPQELWDIRFDRCGHKCGRRSSCVERHLSLRGVLDGEERNGFSGSRPQAAV